MNLLWFVSTDDLSLANDPVSLTCKVVYWKCLFHLY